MRSMSRFAVRNAIESRTARHMIGKNYSCFLPRCRFLGHCLSAAVLVFFSELSYGWAQEKSPAQSLIYMITGSLPIVLAAPHGGSEALPGVAVGGGRGLFQFITNRGTSAVAVA